MKKTTLALAISLICIALQAQNFEGIIRWSFKMEITDPATKAKMEAAQKKMQDPASQQKMKEMQAKMNDPEFKKMLEANPQMKAQMEGVMKMMESGDMNSMMPRAIEVRVKNMNARSKMEGGMLDGIETLYLKDKSTSYRIDRQNKTYSVLPSPAALTEDVPEAKVTKTSETTMILGYTCTKYFVQNTIDGKTVEQFIWATSDIKGFDLKHMSTRDRTGASFYFDKIDGVPLKMEMMMPEGNMVMEAIGIKKQSLPASDFVIPSDYKEVDTGFGH